MVALCQFPHGYGKPKDKIWYLLPEPYYPHLSFSCHAVIRIYMALAPGFAYLQYLAISCPVHVRPVASWRSRDQCTSGKEKAGCCAVVLSAGIVALNVKGLSAIYLHHRK